MEQRKIQVRRQTGELQPRTVREKELVQQLDYRYKEKLVEVAFEKDKLRREIDRLEDEVRETNRFANLKEIEVNSLADELERADREDTNTLRKLADMLCDYEWLLDDLYDEYTGFPWEAWMLRAYISSYSKTHDIFEYREQLRERLNKDEEI